MWQKPQNHLKNDAQGSHDPIFNPHKGTSRPSPWVYFVDLGFKPTV